MAYDPKYQGVSVDHPSIVAAIENLARQGKEKMEIAKIVGMPYEVVDKHVQRVKKKDR